MTEYIIPVREKDLDHEESEWIKEQGAIELVRCRDCKYFKKEDYWVDIGHGAKMLAGGDMPTCKKWADGTCYTKEDGYCYLAERREQND